MQNIPALIQILYSKDAKAAYQALMELQAAGAKSAVLYPHWEEFLSMLSNPNSYVRSRGLLLLASTAQWDRYGRMEQAIGSYLEHVTDEKPITARQCLKGLPTILKAKPQLLPIVRAALLRADTSCYGDSMRPLVQGDIDAVLGWMETQGFPMT